MTRLILIILLGIILSCTVKDNKNSSNLTLNEKVDESTENKINKIPILNFGTFHFGATTDENKTAFNENNENNQQAAKNIAKKLANFKPTVIIVEIPWKYNHQLQEGYDDYLENPDVGENPTETEMIGFEVGRISGAKRIYGIDHKLSYNYRIARDINVNNVDSTLVQNFYKNKENYFPVLKGNNEDLSLIDKLKIRNQPTYLDFMITTNADILTHAATEDNYEGADEAAKYYQRNLRMFTNLNRIKLTEKDRVFILMGASHTAFFRDFINRSPKYKMVNTFDYLK